MKTMQKVVSTPRIAMRGVANQRGSKMGSLFGPLFWGIWRKGQDLVGWSVAINLVT
jgi:hypothetical protein